MHAKDFILCNIVDDDRLPAFANLVADGGFDLEFAAGLEAKIDFVIDREADPSVLRYPGDGGESHAGDAAHDVQDYRNRFDVLDRGEIRAKILFHRLKFHKPAPRKTGRSRPWSHPANWRCAYWRCRTAARIPSGR